MKRITLIILFAAAIIAGSVSCSKVNDIDKRLTQLEQTVSDLKAQVLAGAVITSVEKTEDGCTFTLSNGQSYIVTNGKNGIDGEAIIADVKIEEDFVVLTLKNGEILRISYQNPLSMVTLNIVPDYDDGTVKEPKTTEAMGMKSNHFYLDVAVTPSKYAEILADTEKYIHKAVFSPVKTKSDFGNAFTVSPKSVTYMDGAPVPFLQASFDLDDETAAVLTDKNSAYTVSYSIEDKDGVHGAATAFVTISHEKGSEPDVPIDGMDYVLPGEFSVSATKKVHFSRGNLYYEEGSKLWMFEKEQYDFRTYSDCPCNISDDTETITTTPQGNWGLFGWVGYSTTILKNNPEIYGVSTSVNSTDYGKNPGEHLYADWGTAVAHTRIYWKTLTIDEWEYLLRGRPNADNKVGFATVGNVHGIIILPDNFTDPLTNTGGKSFVPQSTNGWDSNEYTTGENWEAVESAGAVFLPVAGGRESSEVFGVGGSGYYWSQTSHSSYSYRAYIVNISRKFVNIGDEERKYGSCVRLVTESK